jgi:hypothetical protein
VWSISPCHTPSPSSSAFRHRHSWQPTWVRLPGTHVPFRGGSGRLRFSPRSVLPRRSTPHIHTRYLTSLNNISPPLVGIRQVRKTQFRFLGPAASRVTRTRYVIPCRPESRRCQPHPGNEDHGVRRTIHRSNRSVSRKARLCTRAFPIAAFTAATAIDPAAIAAPPPRRLLPGDDDNCELIRAIAQTVSKTFGSRCTSLALGTVILSRTSPTRRSCDAEVRVSLV